MMLITSRATSQTPTVLNSTDVKSQHTPEFSAEYRDTDLHCASSTTQEADPALNTSPSSSSSHNNSPNQPAKTSETDSCSSVQTPPTSIPTTPSECTTKDLVRLSKQCELSPSLLITEPKTNLRYKLRGGERRPVRSHLDGSSASDSSSLAPNASSPAPNASSPAPNASSPAPIDNALVCDIGSLAPIDRDEPPRKKQKKSLINTDIWVSNSSGRSERFFAGNFHMLEELSDKDFLKRVLDTSKHKLALLHSIECHLLDTVPRRTMTFTSWGDSSKQWVGMIEAAIQQTIQVYTKLHMDLVRFEIKLVPVLKGSTMNAPLVL